jgi:GTP-binding nuclear protein Ran
MQQNFTYLLVGDTGVGKSTFLKRHATGQFLRNHVPTTQVTDTQLDFHTTHGLVNLTIKEIPYPTPYPLQITTPIHGLIVMFDVTNRISYKNVKYWIRNSRLMFGLGAQVPIVICGNKCEHPNRMVRIGRIARLLNELLQDGIVTTYYDISARSNYNFEKPFLNLLRQCANMQLAFVAAPALIPVESPVHYSN